MSDIVLKLISDQTSSDNNVRTAAELEFSKLSTQDPSQVLYLCIQFAKDENLPIDIRQSSLLHTKRLVPKYWSIGFPSFTGPPVNQDVKSSIRQDLLNIATSCNNTKLRNGSAYAIVQIASVDYPDEWPDLLTFIYQAASNFDNQISMLGSLTVLNDLFDDLITEDQFWGGIGAEISNYIFLVLSRDNIPVEIKTVSVKLYQSVVAVFSSPEAFSSNERKQFTINHIETSIPTLINVLNTSYNNSVKSQNEIILKELYLRSSIYSVLSSILEDFGTKVPLQLRNSILEITLRELSYISQLFRKSVVEDSDELNIQTTPELDDPENLLNVYVSDLLRTITILQNKIHLGQLDSQANFIKDFVNLSLLTNSSTLDYEDDINTYITDITGLSTTLSARDSVYELISEINDQDASSIFVAVLKGLETSDDWNFIEAYLFIAEALFANDDSNITDTNLSLFRVLELFTKFLSHPNPLVSSRTILLLPKFLEKFESEISVPTIGLKTFTDIIAIAAAKDVNKFVSVSTLVSITYYNQFLNLKERLSPEIKRDVQVAIFSIVYSLIDDCTEDGLAPLLEAVTVTIDINPEEASKIEVDANITVADLIFRIAFKDPANIQLNVDSSDSLRTLLSNILEQDYTRSCDKSLPFILDLLKKKVENPVIEYSPELYLALELLSIIIDAPQFDLPSQLFYYSFPLLRRLILQSSDNQILQNSGEVLINLLKKASKLFLDFKEGDQTGMDFLLSILYKFLSPDLSDSAASNCGTIIFTFINEFQTYLNNDFIFQLLEATVNRLLIAKEPVTIENLIMVFCKLVLNSPEGMIDFLSNMRIPGQEKNGLQLILPIWFESFEVTRGYEKILQNALALAKIFTLGDNRIQSLIVNGDIIPYETDRIITRSMASSMPDEYTQISASLKILKLLVGELEFQNQQPNANDYLPEKDEDEDEEGAEDEGWEDMDDIGVPNFEKLKSYVDSDNEEPDSSDGHSEDLKLTLIQFFRECTTKNLGNFQSYYTQLSEDEKKVITESLLF
ncbi:armadillo-type protein [Scheffersomyces amazonensis]|uniref:armadillo-type protein n=1 Tax=Scheffersomyces amazonensis TaxID=1078765 RepID=UPI00315D3145